MSVAGCRPRQQSWWVPGPTRTGQATAAPIRLTCAAADSRLADIESAPEYRRSACNLAGQWMPRMLTHGGASSHTGPVPVVAEPAPRTSLVSTGRPRNDPNIAPIAGAHRTQITGSGNVARAAISEVLPTF